MARKLAQLNAILVGKKSEVAEQVTALYKIVQKPAMFQGFTKTYEPYKVEGDGKAESVPEEKQIVQARYRDVLSTARLAWSSLIDKVYSQDCANTKAKADIVVDGAVMASGVPVSTILFLKKQFTDIHTFLTHLPEPDQGTKWEYDPTADFFRSEVKRVQKTKKVKKVVTKIAPTKEHPGQAEVYDEDTPIGEYVRTDFSSGCPQDIRKAMVERTSKVLEALKVAQEAANMHTEAPDEVLASTMFDFIFSPMNNQGGK